MAITVELLLASFLLLIYTTSYSDATYSDSIDTALGRSISAGIHADSHTLDSWISHTIQDFEERKAELANGIAATLGIHLQRAENRSRVITVRQDGTGDFRTVTEAVDSIPDRNRRRIVIKIGPGVYREKVKVEGGKWFVTFYGDPVSMPTITFDGTAAVYGTWDSASVIVESNYFMACNIIFEVAFSTGPCMHACCCHMHRPLVCIYLLSLFELNIDLACLCLWLPA